MLGISLFKVFYRSFIDNLEANGHVEKEDIDELDEKEGYIWNQLNKIAKTFSISKIIEYLKRLGLYFSAQPVMA